MRTLAHVSIQTWRGWDPNDLFEGWFSALGGFKNPDRDNGLNSKVMLNIALTGSPGAVVYQDYYTGH
jgi:hypothetical protein